MTPLKPAPITAIRQPSRAIAVPPCVLVEPSAAHAASVNTRAARARTRTSSPWRSPSSRWRARGSSASTGSLRPWHLQLDPHDRAQRADMHHLGARALLARRARHDVDVLGPDVGVAAAEQLDRCRFGRLDPELLVPDPGPAARDGAGHPVHMAQELVDERGRRAARRPRPACRPARSCRCSSPRPGRRARAPPPGRG